MKMYKMQKTIKMKIICRNSFESVVVYIGNKDYLPSN